MLRFVTAIAGWIFLPVCCFFRQSKLAQAFCFLGSVFSLQFLLIFQRTFCRRFGLFLHRRVHWQGERINKLRRSWASARAAGLADDVVAHTPASHCRDLAHAARRGLLGGVWLPRHDGRNADDRVWSPPSRLPEGGEGRILTVDGGGPKCMNANGTGRQLTRAASRTFNG